MRIIPFLLVAVFSALAKSESYDASPEQAKDNTYERQFISSLRKWIFGRSDEMETPKTQIKYLPIYVPVPVYSKKPSSGEYYGAFNHDKNGQQELQSQHGSSLPYAHTEEYGLPFSGQLPAKIRRTSLPYYLAQYGEQLVRPNYANLQYPSSYYSQYQDNGEAYYSDDSAYGPDPYQNTEASYSDSEVIENPLIRKAHKAVNAEGHLRKRKRHKKKGRSDRDY